MNSWRHYRRLLCALLAACCCLAWSAAAQSAAPDSAEPLKYRRYFVPYDRPQDWPKGDISYVPIEKEEFDRLIGAVQSAPQMALAASARVSRAVYEARLNDRDSLAGKARLEITHDAENPVLLPLDPCGVAIDSVQWDDPEDPEAMFGLAADGRPAVYVARTGTLLFDWSLRGRRDATGAAIFALDLPRSPFASFVVDLPRDLSLAASSGVVAEHVATAESLERWRVELGGQNRLTLKLSAASSADQQQRRLALLQQKTRYDFSPGGLDVTEELTLDVHAEPLYQLELDVDPELHLMSARYGEVDVDWSVAASSTPQGKRRIVIDLPEPLLGARQQLQLRALAPLVENQLWTLPAIRPRGVFWQEGSIELLTPAPLTLDRLSLAGCREARSGALPAPLKGESIELQAFTPSAAVQLLLSRRRQPLRLRGGTQIHFKPDRIEAVWRGEFAVDEGERLALNAEVLAGWTIDSVKASPEEMLDERTPLEIDDRNLNVRLTSPLARERPVTLQIAAHRSAASRNQPLQAGDFEILKFRGASTTERLLALSAQPPYLLRVEGAEDQPRLESDSLTNEQRQWFAESPAGALFDLAQSEAGWSATLEELPPRYRAERLKVEATLTSGPLIESYSIRIAPESAPIDRCLIHFTQPREEPLKWRDSARHVPLNASRLTKEQQAKAGLQGGETWEITLASPQSEPFEIFATRSVKLEGEVAVSLAMAPRASSQKGLVEIRVNDAVPATVRNLRLKPASLPSAPENQYSTERGAYVYDPAAEIGAPSEPAIVVFRPAASGEMQGALIWDLRLESRYETTGKALHLASCLIESSGRPSCTLTFPDGAEVLEMWVDDAPARWTASHGRVTAPLPPGRRFPKLDIQFATAEQPLGVRNACTAPWPEADISVLARHWSVWAPPDYDLLGAELGANQQAPLSWSQRWFGILGRPSGEKRFEPALGEGWLSVAAAAGRSAPRTGKADAEHDADEEAEVPPWIASTRAGSRDADHAGWRHYHIAAADAARIELRFVDRSSAAAAGWAALALVLGFSRWFLRGRLPAQVGLMGLLAIVALFVPEVAAPIGSGALLGAFASLAVELCAPIPLSAQPGGRSPSAAALKPESLAAYSIFAAFIVSASMARAADDAPPDAASREDRVYRVLIPSDADGKPKEGDRYQIPQDFRAELRRRAMAATGEPHGWLIKSALYEARLGRSDSDMRVSVVDFAVRYSLEVLSPDTRVRIPLSRLRTSLAPDSAALDSQPIDLAWEEGGEALFCDVPDPGSYALEFKLLPVVDAGSEHSHLDLPIPPVPAAVLKLQAPSGLTGVEVSGAVGPLNWSENRESAMVRLGPSARLALRWPQMMGGQPPAIEVDEWMWLKVRPGSVVVDVLLQYLTNGGQTRQLEVAADRRLRLIPPGPDSPIALYRVLPGAGDMADSPQTFQFDLSQPLVNQLSLPLSLLLTETSGIGNLRLPMLKAANAHSRRRWLAVSVDPGLEVSVQNDETLEPVDVAEFASKWQAKNIQPPLLAYRLPPGEIAWSLATRPREPATTVKQTLALSFHRGGAQVQFDAELMTTAGYCFQHRLLVPAALEVDSVSLKVDDAERLERWSRDDEGMINIFLSARTTGPQRLSLRGRLPTSAAGRFALPTIEIQGSEPLPQGNVIRIYRQPSVLASVEEPQGLVEIAEPAGDNRPEHFGRAVASLAAERRNFSAMLSVKANEPLVNCVQVTSLQYEENGWKADVEHRLNVEQGVLDVLRFEIPAGWEEPFKPTPQASVEAFEDRPEGKKRLIVRPFAAFEKGRHRLMLATRLDLADDPQVRMPDIRPLQSGSLERYVVLPTQVGVEQVAWETAGLIAADLPEGFATPFAPEAFEVYRVTGDAPSAKLNPVERSGDTARVRLADIQLEWRADGRRLAVASFDLEPTGQSTCPLYLPPDWRLVQLSVDGLPVTPIPADAGWQLPLNPNRLPQRIEVIAIGTAGEAGEFWSDFELSAPSLGDLPVEQTLWSFTSPPGWEFIESGKMAQPIDSIAYEEYRLKSMALLVSGLSSDMAATTPAAELADWRRKWARRLAAAKAALDRKQIAAGSPGAAAALDQYWSELASRAGLADLMREFKVEAPGDQAAELWNRVRASGAATQSFLVQGNDRAPRFRSLRVGSTGLWQRAGGAAALALATLLLMAASRRGVLVELVRRWPQAVMVALGICWWLWLSPSFIGWALVALGLVTVFQAPWGASREANSTMAPSVR